MAGDGDFTDVLEFVAKELKKKIIIFGWNDSTSVELKKFASEDCFFSLDDFWKEISKPDTNATNQ